MESVLKFVSAVLLIINGAGVLWGGTELLRDITGKSMGWSWDMMAHTPLSNYFIPGVLLFIVNGLCSLIALLLLIFSVKRYSQFILIQGTVLVGWTLVQVFMVRTFVQLHFIMGVTGITLMICGWLLYIIASPTQVSET